jgi:hypothetical protein
MILLAKVKNSDSAISSRIHRKSRSYISITSTLGPGGGGGEQNAIKKVFSKDSQTSSQTDQTSLKTSKSFVPEDLSIKLNKKC